MKKMLLLFAAGCTLLFTGCSKDDKDGGANLSLNETNISLHHEQTKQLKASDAVTWSSESNFRTAFRPHPIVPCLLQMLLCT